MQFRHSVLVTLVLWSTTWSYAMAAPPHRVLILDVLAKRGGPTSSIMAVEVETGKVSASTTVGWGPEIGLSEKADLLAVLTFNVVQGRFRPNSRLEIFRTADLVRLESGLLPFKGRLVFQEYGMDPTLAF